MKDKNNFESVTKKTIEYYNAWLESSCIASDEFLKYHNQKLSITFLKTEGEINCVKLEDENGATIGLPFVRYPQMAENMFLADVLILLFYIANQLDNQAHGDRFYKMVKTFADTLKNRLF